ncbi:MAG: hypothetical protein JWQ88_1968, partial [Rhodoferax sp.]|nr:hypothetical protein [Rhodoferax sp.]
MNKKHFPRWTAALLGIGAIAMHGAQAQGGAPASAVTLYGIVDAGIEVVNKVNGVGSIQRMPSNTGMIPSR